MTSDTTDTVMSFLEAARCAIAGFDGYSLGFDLLLRFALFFELFYLLAVTFIYFHKKRVTDDDHL